MTTGGWPWAVALLGGLAGSVHCLGMCGGFVAILAHGPRPVLRLGLYNAGRIAMLGCLGLVSGALGATVVAAGPAVVASRILAVVGGGIMVLVALEVLGAPIGLGHVLGRFTSRVVAPALRPVLDAPTMLAPVAFGIMNALLPCHLVWAFAAQAATTGDPFRGGALMLAFGLGTLPAMMAGGAAARVATHAAPRLVRVAGVVVLLVGALTVARGLGPSGTHLHEREHAGGHHELHER